MVTAFRTVRTGRRIIRIVADTAEHWPRAGLPQGCGTCGFLCVFGNPSSVAALPALTIVRDLRWSLLIAPIVCPDERVERFLSDRSDFGHRTDGLNVTNVDG